jgi:hypothetical protein
MYCWLVTAGLTFDKFGKVANSSRQLLQEEDFTRWAITDVPDGSSSLAGTTT